MKRTTYIMIGMLVTGVAMVCGLMFYVWTAMSLRKIILWKSAENGKRCSCPRAGC